MKGMILIMEFIAKNWKKIGLLIVIIACLFNVVSKLVAKVPYMDHLKESAKYVSDQEQKNNT